MDYKTPYLATIGMIIGMILFSFAIDIYDNYNFKNGLLLEKLNASTKVEKNNLVLNVENEVYVSNYYMNSRRRHSLVILCVMSLSIMTYIKYKKRT